SYFANVSPPSAPAALSDVVASIRGLHNFRLKPRIQHREQPEFTSNGGVHYIAPDDFATIYNVTPLYNAGIDGSAQRIAIVGQTGIRTTDIQTFRTRFNLSDVKLEQVLVPGETDPGVLSSDLAEADLDIELASAVARNATIVYVYSGDVFTSVGHAIDANLA